MLWLKEKFYIYNYIYNYHWCLYLERQQVWKKKKKKLNSNVRLNKATVIVSQTGSSPVGGGVRPVWPPASTRRLVADTAAGWPTLPRHLNLQLQTSLWFLPLWTLQTYRDLQDTELGCRDCPEGADQMHPSTSGVWNGWGYLSEGGGVFLKEGRRSQLAGVKRIQLPQIDLTVRKTEISHHLITGHSTLSIHSLKNCIIFH